MRSACFSRAGTANKTLVLFPFLCYTIVYQILVGRPSRKKGERMDRTIRFIDLFAGIGGIWKGFELL